MSIHEDTLHALIKEHRELCRVLFHGDPNPKQCGAQRHDAFMCVFARTVQVLETALEDLTFDSKRQAAADTPRDLL